MILGWQKFKLSRSRLGHRTLFISVSLLVYYFGFARVANGSISEQRKAHSPEPNTPDIVRKFPFLFPLNGPRDYRFFATQVQLDWAVLQSLDLSEQATSLREKEITGVRNSLKNQTYQSQPFVQQNENLLKLLEQKAIVLQWNFRSQKTLDKEAEQRNTLLNIRRQQAQIFNELLLGQPRHQKAQQWKIGNLVSRIRMGEPSARDEAKLFIQQQNSRDTVGLKFLQLAADADDKRMAGRPDELRALQTQLTAPPDKAFVKILLGEALFQARQYQSSLGEFLESLGLFQVLDKKRSNWDELLRFAARRAVDIDLIQSCNNSIRVTQILSQYGFLDLMFGYLEQCSLSNAGKNLPLALKGYVDILSRKEIDEQNRRRIEIRMLDLTILSGDTDIVVSAWERIVRLSLQSEPQILSQVAPSLLLLREHFKRTLNTTTAQRVLRLDELFKKNIPSYATRYDQQLMNLQLIYDAGYYPEAIKNTDALIQKVTDRYSRAIAYKINLNSRAFALGLSPQTGLKTAIKIIPDSESVKTFVAYSEQLSSLIPKSEHVVFLHLAAQILLLSGQFEASMKQFEAAFTGATGNQITRYSARFLLDMLRSKGDEDELEKFLRIFKINKVAPAGYSLEDAERQLSETHLRNAARLLSRKKYDECAARYSLFYKEFPSNSQAPFALERSGFCFSQVFKAENAITQFKEFLIKHPNHDLAAEVQWMLAEVHAKSKEFESAAKQYIIYARMRPEQAKIRGALLKAADSLFFAENFKDSIQRHESALATIKEKSERVRILSSIAFAGERSGDVGVQLSALDRLRQLVTSNDELIGINSTMMELYEGRQRDDLVLKTAKTILQFKVSSRTSLLNQSIAKFKIASFDVNPLRDVVIETRANPKSEIQKLTERFTDIKEKLIAPCEYEMFDFCAQGCFESSTLAWSLAEKIDGLKIPKYLTAELTNDIRTLFEWNSDKLKLDSLHLGRLLEDTIKKTQKLSKSELEKMESYISSLRLKSDQLSQSDDEPTELPSSPN